MSRAAVEAARAVIFYRYHEIFAAVALESTRVAIKRGIVASLSSEKVQFRIQTGAPGPHMEVWAGASFQVEGWGIFGA
jgi:hypothetical protein